MTLKFNRVIAVVAVHVCAKFHQAMCSGSRIIMKTKKGIKKTQQRCWKQYCCRYCEQ